MSTRTIPPSSLEAAQTAQLAPTFPAPIIEIFGRGMSQSFFVNEPAIMRQQRLDAKVCKRDGEGGAAFHPAYPRRKALRLEAEGIYLALQALPRLADVRVNLTRPRLR